MVGLLITWLVTTVSFLISKLPIAVEIDSFGKAAISVVVFGVLNAILRPVLGFLTFPFIILTFGLFLFILNALIFGLGGLSSKCDENNAKAESVARQAFQAWSNSDKLVHKY